jgi:hypothetical protein
MSIYLTPLQREQQSISWAVDQFCANTYFLNKHLEQEEIEEAAHDAEMSSAHDDFVEGDSKMLMRAGEIIIEDNLNLISKKMIGQLVLAAYTGSKLEAKWLEDLVNQVCKEKAEK